MKAVIKQVIIYLIFTTAFTISKKLTYNTRDGDTIDIHLKDRSSLPMIGDEKYPFERLDFDLPKVSHYSWNPIYITIYVYESRQGNMLSAFELELKDVSQLLLDLSTRWGFKAHGTSLILKKKGGGSEDPFYSVNEITEYLKREVEIFVTIKVLLNCETFFKERVQIAGVIWSEYKGIEVNRYLIGEGIENNCQNAAMIVRIENGKLSGRLSRLYEDIYGEEDFSTAQLRVEQLVKEAMKQNKVENKLKFDKLLFLE
jgi:hypothetical protein